MAKSDIWIKLYIGDYLADTQTLSTEEHGAYLLLLMSYYRTGPLPNDEKKLALIVNSGAKKWKTIAKSVMPFFYLHKDGLWHHKRADEEMEKNRASADANKDKAKAAAEARWHRQEILHATSNAPSMEYTMLQASEMHNSPDAPSMVSQKLEVRSQKEQEQKTLVEVDEADLRPDPVLPLGIPNPYPLQVDPYAVEKHRRIKESVERVFSFYCHKVGRNPKRYSLTDARREKAIARMRERIKVHDGDMALAEADLAQAVENLAASEFHQSGGYLDWTEQIFRSAEEFEKRLNWTKAGGITHGRASSRSEQVAASSENIDADIRSLGFDPASTKAAVHEFERARQRRIDGEVEGNGSRPERVLDGGGVGGAGGLAHRAYPIGTHV